MHYTTRIDPTHSVPVHEIKLAELSAPIEISDIFRSLEIGSYVYTFDREGIILKAGMSLNKSDTPGERIYRQAGHIDGWDTPLLGASGSDFLAIAEKYKAITGKTLSRMDVSIKIYDLTDETSPNVADEHFHVKRLERALIKEHIDIHGVLPIGNTKDESYIDNKAYISREVFNGIFEAEDDNT